MSDRNILSRRSLILIKSDGFIYDSLKYLLEYGKGTPEANRIVVLAKTNEESLRLRRSGLAAVTKYSLELLNILRYTKVYVSNYLSKPPYSKEFGINSVTIFHGFGTKRTPANTADRKQIMMLRRRAAYTTYMVCLAERDGDYFFDKMKSTMNRIPAFIPIGLPRNDILLDEAARIHYRKYLNEILGANPHSFLYLYAPTWRESDKIGGANLDWFPTREELTQFSNILDEIDGFLIIRPHPYSNQFIEQIKNRLVDSLPRIRLFTAQELPDIQNILCGIDVLISDYSSTFVDFLLTGRPMAYLVKDLSHYLINRGMTISYDNNLHTPGPKVDNIINLGDYFRGLARGVDDYAQVRKEAAFFYHKYVDGHATERCWDFIINI